MTDYNHIKIISSIVLGVFLATQILFVGSVLLIPKPAEAFGLPTMTTIIGNIWQFLQDLAKGILYGIAMKFIEKFITKFVNKLTDKYKIRNYLYYDQVLTNYYLNNFIRDKIKDPKLREIYTLMESAYITGKSTGIPGQPDPRKALVPRLKQAIYKQYVESGGIPEGTVYNPPKNISSVDYYSAARLYWFNPPSFVERNLQAQFGAFQSAATTAAQLEIMVGNGLKAGRFVGGTCGAKKSSYENSTTDNWLSRLGLIKTVNAQEIPSIPVTNGIPGNKLPGEKIPIPDPNASPQSCQQFGGEWKPSALDQARSFIDNPTGFIGAHLSSFLETQTSLKFKPDKFATVVGTLVGGLIFDQFALNKKGGTLDEDPRGFTPEESPASGGDEYDIDDDGIGDGFDYDGDKILDVCTFGGSEGPVGPPCKGSKGEYTEPEPPGACEDLGNRQPIYTHQLRTAEEEVDSTNPGGVADALNTKEGAFAYLEEVAKVLRARGLEATTGVLNGHGNPNSGDLIAIWKEGDTLAERFDAVSSVGAEPGGEGSRPMREARMADFKGAVSIEACVP